MKKRLFKREIQLALEAKAKGKAPGPNGRIVEFFLSMWLVIGREYTKMMIHDAILNDYFPHNFTRVLMQVISQDQSAFLPFRYILNNILLTHETITWAKKFKQPPVFFKLDFSKASNKIN
ncbi:unnamed protein product [Sphagnum troendelagicum]|uniref:Reverse transcriptase domain-containing protein n=1 Tax=Sphagnum troendelagicum TaxID=128251 RepID=A0ABP0T8Z4_9BRYO